VFDLFAVNGRSLMLIAVSGYGYDKVIAVIDEL